MLDLQGEVVWEYGREGRGPGEFSYPTGFGVTDEGRQVVADMGNGTLVLVDPAGELEGTMRVADGVGFPTGNLIVLDREVLALPDPDQYATAAPEDTLSWRVRAYHLDRPDARVWGEVWRAPEPEGTGEPLTLGDRTLSVRVAGLTHLRSFWPRPRLTRAGQVLALFDSTSYRVGLYRTDGSPVRDVERAVAPLPVTEAIREGERDRRRGVIDAGEGPRFQLSGSDGSAQGVDQAMVDDFVREQIDVMSFWPEIPVLRDVLGGPDGSLWVQRNDPSGQPGRIDLFDPDGAYRGTLPADSPFPIALGPRGLAAYVDVSELGVTELRVESWPGADPGPSPSGA